jgi:hypothetical protein
VNLQNLRDYIRVQLDMDEEELPNALLDSYLHEAYLRTMSMERRWPFFETYFEVANTPDADLVALPAECDENQIISLIKLPENIRLIQIAPEMGDDRFTGTDATSNAPVYYSIWGNAISLWPRPYPDVTTNFRIRGYRKPTNWVAQGSSAEVDADPRLHILLAHYAIALCYAQQEDEVLEDVYMKRWQASFAAARSAICGPRHHRPLVLNGGLMVGTVAPDLAWNLPT